jgi:hypothetical protein
MYSIGRMEKEKIVVLAKFPKRILMGTKRGVRREKGKCF